MVARLRRSNSVTQPITIRAMKAKPASVQAVPSQPTSAPSGVISPSSIPGTKARV
ncbi:hypothetical protein MU852_14955 [Brevundimonas albigilva]|uniref:hypothetical protein n=1 Tax=Brevundimonas albigilva TaxID=1312364 RepID=UPI00201B70AA|nr:hypothetical protein [Brevundimonas albigilva]UQV18048.1 hypothetical protein MU852_14955 [Brevundimonas albigilva]